MTSLHRAFISCVLLALSCTLPARAGDRIDVRDWLGRPGVRLVAVEFYATWCKPCMDAMPRWKALKEKYGPAGLRVVVVNTQDPDGGCRALPFVPDDAVCDLNGRTADAFGVAGRLPAAYLWSWQGNLLVEKGHIDEVERAVERYLKDAPRMLVEVGRDVPAPVAAGVRERIADDGKVVLVAGAEERAAIEAARKAQAGAGFDERLACDLGKEVPANALLKVNRVAQEGTAFLHLALYDLQAGCLLTAASTEWLPDAKRMTVDAVAKLSGKLKRAEGAQMPSHGSASRARPDRVADAVDRNWKPKTDDPALVIFDSNPVGARVEVDGVAVCERTPCRKMLAPGVRFVRMTNARFLPHEEHVRVDGEQRLRWKLEPNTGVVVVEASADKAPITVDGEPSGALPQRLSLEPGLHRIEVREPCYEPARADVTVERGDVKTVAIKTSRKPAALRVELNDERGEPVDGDVFLDGQRVGKTWSTLAVHACGMNVEVRSGGETWREIVSLTPYETTKTAGVLEGGEKKRIRQARADAEGIAPRASGEVRPADGASSPSATVREPGWWKKQAATTAFIVGGGAIAVGTVFAVIAASAGSDVRSKADACVANPSLPCPSQSEFDTVGTKSDLANVGLFTGLAAGTLGAYWYLTAPAPANAGATLGLSVSPTGLRLAGSF